MSKKIKHKVSGKVGTVDFSVELESFPPKYEVRWEDETKTYEFREDLKSIK